MAKHILYVLLSIALFTSCSGDHQHQPEKHDKLMEIELNDGDKWKVNPEMKPFIQNQKALLAAYSSIEDGNYRKLAEDLKAENNALIQSCTMKGASHDELHKWLHPHIELIDNLSKAGSKEEAEEVISKIQTSFNTYNNYFE